MMARVGLDRRIGLRLVGPCLLLSACGAEPSPVEPPRLEPIAMPPACTTEQAAGPPAMKVDGLVAVPIDMTVLTAHVELDLPKGEARVEAKVDFVMGPLDGFPLLDLRQTIIEAELNGTPVDPEKIRPHDLGAGEGAEMLVLEASAKACSENTLTLRYSLGAPNAPNAVAPTLDAAAGEATWAFAMSDLTPGRFLEQWFPANLIHDGLAMSLTIDIVGAKTPHVAITNGLVEQTADDHLEITFPPHFTAQSPMMLLLPESRVDHLDAMIDILGGEPIPLHLYAEAGAGFELASVRAQIADFLIEWSDLLGPYTHDALTVYVGPSMGGMEYTGGTTTNLGALRHELFHQWFARGASPVNQGSGWSDEALAMYFTEIYPKTIPETLTDDPLPLDTRNPFTRVTHRLAYVSGGRMLASVADQMGVTAFRDEVRSFYDQHRLLPYASTELEMHLYCTNRTEGVRRLFHRYVYGLEGDPPPLPASACP